MLHRVREGEARLPGLAVRVRLSEVYQRAAAIAPDVVAQTRGLALLI